MRHPEERHAQPRRTARAERALRPGGASWLDRARRGLQAARVIAETAPDSSVILACDAARRACVALLAQQGLHPTTAGHVSGWRPFSR
jgi:hypothetical protein